MAVTGHRRKRIHHSVPISVRSDGHAGLGAHDTCLRHAIAVEIEHLDAETERVVMLRVDVLFAVEIGTEEKCVVDIHHPALPSVS
ncbi:hypothetical protein HQ346_21885 [Rhodococcus sp. BP-252]|nr:MULTISPECIES: hypothetical protein [Rhodococcus]MBY6412929.1 hypothetical protein [Rhodococcus sp. BP-320]MBY6419469.1 hypothetical protein [Rhodococcus sp. BP-321]MBY6423877.1 hypothetical protein [Rhodococcus sp. BP-324]MBY6429113.1 hypothetical protein [Rhodococcus sp. BP-323]MBY6432851.1 hypothetical protein [Rhodococcus sp. BP-322]MBY6441789.1 hypothetical protein [Rhodococcus sp. BP-319]MBY6446773.1 hypothetical protein [Rhodococcus sp. BP-318]MBY6451571.1 hypothetical protein [Rho